MYLVCHVTSHDLIEGSCKFLCKFLWRELLAVCYHPDKPCDHRYCESGDMFLICHVTLRDHMFKELLISWGYCPSS